MVIEQPETQTNYQDQKTLNSVYIMQNQNKHFLLIHKLQIILNPPINADLLYQQNH